MNNEQEPALINDDLYFHQIPSRVVRDTKIRLNVNPEPDDLEVRMGAFREMFEPHTRQAVILAYRKGYAIEFAGFDKLDPDCQVLSGFFSLNNSAVSNLSSAGFYVKTDRDLAHQAGKEPGWYTYLYFYPRYKNERYLIKLWGEMSSLLPDARRPPPAAVSIAEKYNVQNLFAPERKNTKKERLLRKLELLELSDSAREEIEQEIKSNAV